MAGRTPQPDRSAYTDPPKILTNTFLSGWVKVWTWILAGLMVAAAGSNPQAGLGSDIGRDCGSRRGHRGCHLDVARAAFRV